MNHPIVNINKKYLSSAILLLALTGCGKASSPAAATAASSGSSSPQAATSASSSALLSNGNGNNYVTGDTLKFVDANGATGSLPAGTAVTMLDTKDGYAHLGVDSDDDSVPSEVWVKSADASAAKLQLQAERDLNESDDSVIEDAGRGMGGGMTYCYRYVKEYLQSHHLVRGYLPGGSAYMAAPVLQHLGWRNIGSPASAKVNDVCVYHGGRGNNGHIEVRVSGGWYYGYGVKSHPITRVNHTLIGCYRK